MLFRVFGQYLMEKAKILKFYEKMLVYVFLTIFDGKCQNFDFYEKMLFCVFVQYLMENAKILKFYGKMLFFVFGKRSIKGILKVYKGP